MKQQPEIICHWNEKEQCFEMDLLATQQAAFKQELAEAVKRLSEQVKAHEQRTWYEMGFGGKL